jgi:hypothetical protein
VDYTFATYSLKKRGKPAQDTPNLALLKRNFTSLAGGISKVPLTRVYIA